MKTHIYAAGASITTGVASASVAIPSTSAAGIPPKFIRVSATAAASVRLGAAGVVATPADTLIQPGDSLVLAVGQSTNIAAIQQTATGTVQISPFEDN